MRIAIFKNTKENFVIFRAWKNNLINFLVDILVTSKYQKGSILLCLDFLVSKK